MIFAILIKRAWTSPRDVAGVAAAALTGEGHASKIYAWTGAELLSAPEQVQMLGKALGMSLKCLEIPAEKIAEQMTEMGLPPFLIDSMVKMWARIKCGGMELQTNDLANVTSSKGETFAQWCEKNQGRFESKKPVAHYGAFRQRR